MTTTQQVTAYQGRVKGHHYVVHARHGFLDTSATVMIDGVVLTTGSGADGEHGEPDGPAFRTEEAFGKVVHTVRRPDAKGKLRDAEQIVVRTAGFGGKGEVDVLGGMDAADISRTPLMPQEGSASWEREQRRIAHPVRFALGSAAFTAVKYLVPLLGLGALFGGVLRPVREAAESWVRPPVEAIARLLGPVRRALAWVREHLLGWVPEISLGLPFDVPGWVVDVGVPVLVVLVVFVATLLRLRTRRRHLGAVTAHEPATAATPPAGR